MKRINISSEQFNQLAVALILGVLFGLLFSLPAHAQVNNPQNKAMGLEGKISTPPPTTAATLSSPTNGQTFTELPITVSGLCQTGLLIKIFKNNVFSGSAQCNNGSFSVVMDLFDGANELVVRVYDELDQAGPDSNIVTVTYNNPVQQVAPNVSLTSNFAKRGATPGTQLTWPIALSGGTGPYAVSVDWGDGKPASLLSRQFAGAFDIQHIYDSPGVYNILVKVTDVNGNIAYLQLVGVGNGPLSQDNRSAGSTTGGTGTTGKPKSRIVWQPAALLLPLLGVTFWLGKRHELHIILKKVEESNNRSL